MVGVNAAYAMGDSMARVAISGSSFSASGRMKAAAEVRAHNPGPVRAGVRRRSGTGTRTRLTLRGKIVVACAVALLSWVGWSAVSAQTAQSDEGTVEVVNYTVRPGDSLWSYAAQITPQGDDVSERVDLIMKLNNLDSPELKPGQTLVVPAE